VKASGSQGQEKLTATVPATSSDYSEILEIGRSASESLNKDRLSFFDKKAPFIFNLPDVARVEVMSRAFNGSFVKNGDVWAQTDPSLQKVVDSAKLNDALKRLSEIQAQRTIEDVKIKPGHSKLRLVSGTGATVFEFEWGDSVRELVPVRTSQLQLPIAVSEDDVKAIDPGAWFKSPETKPE
jgi:hypothetical protein